jgi:hypothetical protein
VSDAESAKAALPNLQASTSQLDKVRELSGKRCGLSWVALASPRLCVRARLAAPTAGLLAAKSTQNNGDVGFWPDAERQLGGLTKASDAWPYLKRFSID